MDTLTLNYYEENAASLFDKYESVESGIAAYFQASFPMGGTIVDIGAGSGRDTRKLLELGYDAYGVEPTEAFRNLAQSRHSSLKGRIWSGSLPHLTLRHQVDGLVCSAVLMHLPENQLFDALLSLRDALKIHGRLLLSIPSNRPGLDENYRDGEQRLFQPIEASRMSLLAERLGLRLVSRWGNFDTLHRPDHHWTTLLFEKIRCAGRPLDRIESILNRDRKVATYKLALLRGLCDLAAADDSSVDWCQPKEVGISLDNLAERWLFYYWPLFASPEFIPQMQAESSNSTRLVKFRPSLTQLIAHYYALGGLDAFALDYRSGRLGHQAKNILDSVLRDIRSAIVQGPVTHAEQGSMFRYDQTTRRVYCDVELWQEFCLTGYWIRDALLLRWTELTIRFAPHLSRGIVLEQVIREPVIDREVTVARQCYLKQEGLCCVWSGKSIQPQTLAVDHALPFALWRNNDLWNLLPSHKAVNGQKSDKVPSTDLLTNRRDAIVFNWKILRQEQQQLFEFELNRLLGEVHPTGWENLLFDYLKRNSEYGVFLRGIQSWDGCTIDEKN